MKILAAKSKINIDQIKPGRVLIARNPMKDELLNKSVILILEHDETGSTGIILNKKSISFDPAPESEEIIYYGGSYDTHRVGVILSENNSPQKAIKISDEIYYSENHFLLKEKNFSQALNTANLKAFIGFTVWKSGQLEQELENNDWWVDDFKTSELFIKDMDLWEYKLQHSDNMFALFYNKLYLSFN